MSRARRLLVAGLVVLATLAAFVSTLAVWSHGVLLETDEWVATVGPLADDPDVTRAVSEYLVEQTAVAVDFERLAADALPERADALAAPLATSIQRFLTEQATDLLQGERFRSLWIDANRVAHRRAVQVLTGGSEAIATTGGEVTLNLVPAVALLLDRLAAIGLLPGSFEPPPVDWQAPATASVAALSDAIGVELAPTFGQITVFRSATLQQAQDGVALFERLVVLTVVAFFGLVLAAVLVARDRRRTVIALALGTAGALVASRALVGAVAAHVVGLVSEPDDRSAVAAVARGIEGNLEGPTRVGAVACLAIAATAYLVGPAPAARRVRGWLRPAPGTGAAAATTALATAVAPRRDALVVVGILVTLAVVVVVPPTFLALVVVGGALAAYAGGLAVLTRKRAP